MTTRTKTLCVFPLLLAITATLGETLAAQRVPQGQGGIQIADGMHRDTLDRAMDAGLAPAQNTLPVAARPTLPDTVEYADDDCD